MGPSSIPARGASPCVHSPTHPLEEGPWPSAQAPTPAQWMPVGGMDATWVLHPSLELPAWLPLEGRGTVLWVTHWHAVIITLKSHLT